jgi:vacuolar-type H+-ATPase subunit H
MTDRPIHTVNVGIDPELYKAFKVGCALEAVPLRTMWNILVAQYIAVLKAKHGSPQLDVEEAKPWLALPWSGTAAKSPLLRDMEKRGYLSQHGVGIDERHTISAARVKAENIVENAQERAKEITENARRSAQDSLAQAKQTAETLLENARERAKEITQGRHRIDDAEERALKILSDAKAKAREFMKAAKQKAQV